LTEAFSVLSILKIANVIYYLINIFMEKSERNQIVEKIINEWKHGESDSIKRLIDLNTEEIKRCVNCQEVGIKQGEEKAAVNSMITEIIRDDRYTMPLAS